MISVGDTGTGVDAKIRDRVFEPFFTTKEVGEGSGTTVTLLLPRAKPEAVEKKEPAIPHESDDTKPAAFEGKGKPILVVEDNKNVRHLAVAVLSTLGFQTVEAQDGLEAFALLDKLPAIHLMFSDVVLPGGETGIDIAKEPMRKKPGLKVLLTSGYTEYPGNHETWRQPRMRFIQQPYRIEDLSAMLGDILAEGEKGAG
jgi:CheY-like chemotaxis protein